MALGRGLGDILSEVEEAYEKDLSDINTFELSEQGLRVKDLEIKQISPNPYQPRKHFDPQSLEELSASIVRHGLLQPIVVIETGNDEYILIAGERRFRAHKLAKLETIKAIIADVDIDEIRLRELALIENIQRENLNAIELAHSYAELIEVHKITHDELSNIVHKSRSQITNTMRLLSLSSYVQEQVVEGKISQGHAKVIVGLEEDKQKTVVNSIIGQKLSVRESEKIVKNHKEINTDLKAQAVPSVHLMQAYKEQFKKLLPLKHTLKSKTLEVHFENEEEVESFLEWLDSFS